jgi:hypothetical protein
VLRLVWIWLIPAIIGLLLGIQLWWRSREQFVIVAYNKVNGRRRLYVEILLVNESLRIIISGCFVIAGISVLATYGNVVIPFTAVNFSIVVALWLTIIQSGVATWAYSKDMRMQLKEEQEKKQ